MRWTLIDLNRTRINHIDYRDSKKLKAETIFISSKILIYNQPFLIQNITSDSTHFFHGIPPLLNTLFRKLVCMGPERILKGTLLLSDMGRVDPVENRKDQPPTLANLGKFVEAPMGRRVIGRENDDGGGGVFNGFQKLLLDLVAALQPVVVAEDAEAAAVESVVEAHGESVPRVGAPEA